MVATCGSAEKAALRRRLGADRVINYREEDLKAVLRAEYPKARPLAGHMRLLQEGPRRAGPHARGRPLPLPCGCLLDREANRHPPMRTPLSRTPDFAASGVASVFSAALTVHGFFVAGLRTGSALALPAGLQLLAFKQALHCARASRCSGHPPHLVSLPRLCMRRAST